MSIDFYVEEVRSQIKTIHTECTTTVQTMEAIQKALSAIIIEPSLKSKTYDSMKAYFNTAYMPVTKGFILVCETMIESNQTFLDRYLEKVDVNSLQESVLEARITQYNRLTELLESLNDPTKLTEKIIDNVQEMRHHTTLKLHSLQEYDYFSIQIFDDVTNQLTTLETGVNFLSEGKAWNQSTGTFSTTGLDLAWAGEIEKDWKKAEDKKKGIDDETNKKLANYDIIKCYDPVSKKTTWALEKDGLAVIDPELTDYLDKVGKHLDKEDYSMIEVSPKEWEARVNDAWRRNGTDYFSGKEYGGWMSGIGHVQKWVDNRQEDGSWDAMWGIGMSIAAIRNAKIYEKKVNGLVKMQDVNIKGFDIKNKHLNSSTAKRARKFNVSSAEEANKIVQDALKSGKLIETIPNGVGSQGQNSFSSIIDTGKIIGTKGEMHIKIVYDELKNVWTTYPVPKP